MDDENTQVPAGKDLVSEVASAAGDAAATEIAGVLFGWLLEGLFDG